MQIPKKTIRLYSMEYDNTFTLKAGADVNIRAGQEIDFKPGFTAKAGSKSILEGVAF